MNNIKHCFGTLLSGIILSVCVGCQYNPQPTELAETFEPEAISIDSIWIPENWSTHTLYSAYSLSVPNTMEMSRPNDRYSQQLNDIGAPRNEGIIIFQQKSLNEGSVTNADEHYCRLIVNHEKFNAGELLHCWETEVLDTESRAWLLENVKNNLAYPQQLLTTPSYEWIDICGTKAIRVKYRRSGNNGNSTVCAMYYLFNYDEMALVMTAYREQESNLWQCDMENVIRTFRWNHCK